MSTPEPRPRTRTDAARALLQQRVTRRRPARHRPHHVPTWLSAATARPGRRAAAPTR